MKVLVVEAHPDDGTISAGGTIARLIREGHEVTLVYFCPCTEDPKNEGNLIEHSHACAILGIKEIIPYQYARDGYLENHKQEIRDKLWELKVLYEPDLVLCPSIHEFHQDHRAVADCCMTIFRDTSTILGFEVMRSSTPDFKPNVYVRLTFEDKEKKMKVISVYKSQLLNRSNFFTEDKFEANMRFRGTQANDNWAEAFELLWGRI